MKTKLKIVRLEQSIEGALGVLLFLEQMFCVTLEPDSGDPDRFQIPAGQHPLRPFPGNEHTRWHNTIEILVPGHTVLLFHAGNWEEDSTGCVLLGSEAGKLRGDRAVLNSGDTFKRFQREVVPNVVEGGLIEIVDFFPHGRMGA